MTKWSDTADHASTGDYQQVPPAPVAEQAPLGGQLHPAVIGVWSARQLGAMLALVLLNPGFLALALPLVGVFVAASTVRYMRFRWRLEGSALVIEQGLLQRRRRVIPVERVQSVDLVRRVSHRLLGVTAVHVEAIGSGDTEGQLDALSPEVAHRLREIMLTRRAATRVGVGDAAAVGAGDDGETLVRLAPRELLLAGLTEANATLLAAAAGLAWQFLGDRMDEFVERAPAFVGTNAALVAALAGLAAAIVLLVSAQLVLYWDFRLRRTGAELQVRRGLLEQRFDTIPLRRLQALRVEENLPRRLLGYASVKADVAGKPGGGSGGTDTILPFGRATEAHELVAAVLEDDRVVDVRLRPMPPRARTRRMVRALVLTIVVTGAALVVWGSSGLVALLVAVPAVMIAEASYRALGHAELPGLVVTRAGWWVRRTAFVPESRLQTLALRATVLQRWRGLATLELHIARSPGLWSGPQMIDLDRELGRHLVHDLAPVMARRPGAV
jgi:putative membrane protein